MSEHSEPSYHEVPHTLDPNREIPEDAAPSAGTTEEQAEEVRKADEEHTEGVEEAAKHEDEFGPRDPGDHAEEKKQPKKKADKDEES